MNTTDPSIISYDLDPEWDRVSYAPSIVPAVVGYGYEAESDSIRKRRIPL